MSNLEESQPAGLYLVATPIGNLGDITLRALQILKTVNVIYCEDTRVSRILLDHYQIKTPIRAYHDHNGAKLRPHIVNALDQGQSIALISDAGTPVIADPGLKLVQTVKAAGHGVTALPGANAAITALSQSGLPSDQFHFAGFIPQKESRQKLIFEALKPLDATLIFYETAPRLNSNLTKLYHAFGNRPLVIARELTKLFEQITHTNLKIAVNDFDHLNIPLKGEFCLLIGGYSLMLDGEDTNNNDDQLITMIDEALAQDKRVKPLIKSLEGKTTLDKRSLYRLIMERKQLLSTSA